MADIWWHSAPAPGCADCPKRCCHCRPGRLLAPFDRHQHHDQRLAQRYDQHHDQGHNQGVTSISPHSTQTQGGWSLAPGIGLVQFRFLYIKASPFPLKYLLNKLFLLLFEVALYGRYRTPWKLRIWLWASRYWSLSCQESFPSLHDSRNQRWRRKSEKIPLGWEKMKNHFFCQENLAKVTLLWSRWTASACLNHKLKKFKKCKQNSILLKLSKC